MSLYIRFRRRFRLQRVAPATKQPAEQPKEEPRIRTRWFIRRDMPEALAIENASFSSPWTQEQFLQKLSRRDCIGLVVECGRSVIGFMTYELKKNDLVITNFAIDSNHRKKGIGRMMMRDMVEKLDQQRRKRIVVLLPDECAAKREFFMKCGGGVTRIQTTDTKGSIGLQIAIKPMKSKHVVRVQMIEDACLKDDARNIASMLGNGTKGMIAVNTRGIEGDNIVGYVLWEEGEYLEGSLITVNGAIGQITHPDFLHRGIGGALMHHIASLGKTVIVSDIDLRDKDRCRFLRDIGVPVPELSRYMTLEWKPKPTPVA